VRAWRWGAAPCLALITRWSRRPGWDVRHEFALAAGALMTYAWSGFAVTWVMGGADPVRFTGNAIFAASAALFVIIAGRRVFRRQPQSTRSAGRDLDPQRAAAPVVEWGVVDRAGGEDEDHVPLGPEGDRITRP
jgi:hypothetical protein